jgi:hypothetical protein
MAKPPQARNAIRRALLHVAGVRFSKLYKDRCREHFNNRCAYCGSLIEPNSRKGHFDHAVAIASSSNAFHLVYACGSCNGDEKRERDWEGFLREKCRGEDETLQLRTNAILEWFATQPPAHVTEEVRHTLLEAQTAALNGFNAAVISLRDKLNSI